MDHSALSRRGALSAVFGSAAALGVPATARAATPPEVPAAAPALLPAIPGGKHLHLSYVDADSAHKLKTTRLLGDTPPSTDDFTTLGWDTISAVALTDVNNAIAKYGTSPHAWDGTVRRTKFSPEVALSGQFEPWTLTTGGTGSKVIMKIPFSAEVVIVDGEDKTDYVVKGGTAGVEVDLAFDPAQQLRVDTLPDDGKLALVTDVAFVQPAAGDMPDEDREWLNKTLKYLLEQWLNAPANLGQFQHVFTAVDLNSAEAMGDLAWLVPTHTSYAYINGKNEDDSYLGVLCMTENRDPGNAPQELAPGAMLGDQQKWSGFTVSKDRFMHKMVLPGLQHHFPDAKLTVKNGVFTAESEFRMAEIDVDGDSYQPVATLFSVSVDYDRITTHMQLHIPVNGHIDGYAKIEYAIQPTLGQNSKGQACVTYRVVQQDLSQWTTTDGIFGDFELWLGKIADGLGGMLRSVVGDIGLKVLGSILFGGVFALMDGLEGMDVEKALDHLPTADSFAQDATLPIAWTNADVLKPAQVRLHNGAFQLFGPTFA
ncbi:MULTISPECIES: TULIP family P47-like protein [Streptomyces]|uniref:Putative membrane protein n=1 Tax=Streptomyces scabiei (strain 87.22) TaxID=680198 RepID=C9Z4C4_STRSW|nr:MULTISPECIES: TULIP family P47-like protein [Streptomyces]MBP5867436.1 TULIP family P47-like protein [Streptomyces sp. LBUM 1485]MBP5906057.1 TULIP family P47-like protein [Streptomyces sp. LBUM 1478]MBP5931389.1 TULIP family P47-like protein [Streptomyces sp. LBUM 1479]KFG03295.1 hypothetical protein IQ61_41865 [Streptomyces scabiei]MBP5875904.1 TULIP family P47-like protein [Streptomyces sp. LBUM 1477]